MTEIIHVFQTPVSYGERGWTAEARGQGRVAHHAFCMHDHVSRGRIAAVAPYRPEAPVVSGSSMPADAFFSRFPKSARRERGDEGALAGYHRFSGEITLPIAGAPQSDGERADHNGGEGRNSRTVVIKGFADLPKNDRNKVISGAIFVAGIICLCAYLASKRFKK